MGNYTAYGSYTDVSATASHQKIRTATCCVKCPHFFYASHTLPPTPPSGGAYRYYACGEHQKAGGDSSVRVSLTHRLWADAPGQGSDAGRQELARLRLSQQFNPSGQEEHAFKRLAPDPLWADLLLEARVAPVSLLHVSTTAAYHTVETQLVRATAELKLQPLSFWTLCLAPEFAQGSQCEGCSLPRARASLANSSASKNHLKNSISCHLIFHRFRRIPLPLIIRLLRIGNSE